MRTIHRRLGITIVVFLLVQAVAGALMAVEKLAGLENSKTYSLIYTVHADWDPVGSLYRVILGIATSLQGILGIMIFRSRLRFKNASPAISTGSSGPSDDAKREGSPPYLSFAGDIRPLFRERDIAAMKSKGLDLASYAEVKKHAPDIYSRLSAGEMPCDGPWGAGDLETFKRWMETGMRP